MPVDHTILVKKQCAYKTKNGRCKRMTVLTHPYCSHHTKLEQGVYIGPSTIPMAGKGLFAAKVIRKGETIVEYKGEKLTSSQYDRRYDKEGYGSYGMAVTKKLVIDARKTSSGVARYICDYTGSGKRPNVEYQETKNRIQVVALKTIQAGEELLVDYGNEIREAMGFGKAKKSK